MPRAVDLIFASEERLFRYVQKNHLRADGSVKTQAVTFQCSMVRGKFVQDCPPPSTHEHRKQVAFIAVAKVIEAAKAVSALCVSVVLVDEPGGGEDHALVAVRCDGSPGPVDVEQALSAIRQELTQRMHEYPPPP